MESLIKQLANQAQHHILKNCIEQIAPQLSNPQCKPFLAIGQKFIVDGLELKIDTFPFLCDTEEMAQSAISAYDSGMVLTIQQVRQKFNIKIKE